MKKISFYLLFICLILSNIKSNAQQDPMYTMYMMDKMLINPAFAGSSSWVVATAKYRQQFIGFEGNPTTQTFNFHAPIQKRHIGLGFKIINDKTPVTNNLNATLFYSYHLNFAGGKLSAGIEAGIYNRRIDYPKLILTHPLDNSIPVTAVSSIVPDVSLGGYYQKKQFYLGYSARHILKSKFNYNTINSPNSHLYNHMNLLLGNVFDISDKWDFEASTLLKYQKAAPIQFDINGMLSYKERVGVGIQYRSGDAMAGIIKINIMESLRVSYSYDITKSGLSPYVNGAHEIIISYGIKLPPPPQEKEVHPRYYY